MTRISTKNLSRQFTRQGQGWWRALRLGSEKPDPASLQGFQTANKTKPQKKPNRRGKTTPKVPRPKSPVPDTWASLLSLLNEQHAYPQLEGTQHHRALRIRKKQMAFKKKRHERLFPTAWIRSYTRAETEGEASVALSTYVHKSPEGLVLICAFHMCGRNAPFDLS